LSQRLIDVSTEVFTERDLTHLLYGGGVSEPCERAATQHAYPADGSR